jgi:hypothetical protein
MNILIEYLIKSHINFFNKNFQNTHKIKFNINQLFN